VTACALLLADDGEFRTERCRFGTMTGEISKSWLLGWRGLRVERIAMEATGVYGKPVWNILQAGNKFHWLLVKAQRLKQVPGRKTDQKDREWIADVLPHGMLKGSFLPPPPIRGLRDRTRPRAKIRQTMAAFANRVQKV